MKKIVGIFLSILIIVYLGGCNKTTLDQGNIKANKDPGIIEIISQQKIEPHSLWLMQSNDHKKPVGSLIDDYFTAPLISPDKSKILFVKVTKSGGEALFGYPLIYDVKQKFIIEELPPERSVFAWTAGWFSDSNAVLLDGNKILNLNSWETIVLEGQDNNLGGKPSPDGSKILVFNNENSTVNPLKITVYDNLGIAQKIIETPLYPRINRNLDSPMPVVFQWYDNQSIILESWNKQEDTSDIYWLDTSTEKTYKLIENGYSPVFSPGKDKIAVIESKEIVPGGNNNRSIIKIYNPKGDILSQHNFASDLDIYSMDWGNEGPFLYITARFLNEKGVLTNGAIIWDEEMKKSKKVIEMPNGTGFAGVDNDGESLFMYSP